MDRTLSLEFARVVEAAALRSGRLLGRGHKLNCKRPKWCDCSYGYC